ncbi:hypothetical protein [Rheinheimera gaetbuli]
MISLGMTVLIALIFYSALKTIHLQYPANAEQHDNILARAQYLAQWKQTIEQMPEGFEKLDAQRDWFQEVEKLMTATKPTATATHSNIVNLYQLRH